MPVAIGVVGISVDDGGGWTRNVVTTVPVSESTQTTERISISTTIRITNIQIIGRWT